MLDSDSIEEPGWFEDEGIGGSCLTLVDHVKLVKEIRTSVVWFLNQKLMDAANLHKEMMTARLAHNLKKQEL